jgi:preprotein translocase subunit SecD
MRRSRSDVVAAHAGRTSFGAWSVDVRLSSAGGRRWDAVARQSFHEQLAFDLDGHVVSAPMIQPTNASFSSFDGKLQLSGDLSRQETQAVAVALRAP